MKSKRYLFISAVLCLLVILGTGGCNSQDQDLEITVGYFNNVTHAQALLMKSQGTLEAAFEDEADVNWVSFNAGPAEVEALFAGEIDIGYIGPVPGINANVRSKGDIRLLTGASQAGAVLVRSAGSDIESVEDLAGKVVAIPQIANTQHLCLLNLLTECRLAPVGNGGNVTVTAVSNADVENMMRMGHIDAALVPEPWGTTLIEKGAELVLDETEIYMGGDYPVAVVVVRQEFYEEHPDIVQTFLEKHKEATVYLNDHVEEASRIVNAQINADTGKNLSESVLDGAFQRMDFTENINEEALSGFSAICLEQKFIPELPGENLWYQ